MEELRKLISEYKLKNSIDSKTLAKLLSISMKKLNDIEDGKVELEQQEIDALKEILMQKSKDAGRKTVKILDLIFRLVATIMPLVVIILSIYNFSNSKILISLLAIGVACLSMTTLPKIEK